MVNFQTLVVKSLFQEDKIGGKIFYMVSLNTITLHVKKVIFKVSLLFRVSEILMLHTIAKLGK